ncbi:MAG: hypothetical protein GY941_15380 [Planctomycetes bacterium]|nr:hypothetical protein [Planctomycetota bacterium]
MRKIFISIILATLTSYVAWFCVPQFWTQMYDGAILDALMWNGYGAVISTSGPLPYMFLGVYAVICIGLLKFKYWARSGLVVFVVASVVLGPFWGLSVQYGIDVIFGYILTLGQGAMLAISFLTGLSNEFENSA